jgi:sodium/proline symporter
MPQVLLRFMGIRDAKELKRSRRVACIWLFIAMSVAVFIGIVGRSITANLGVEYLSNAAAENVFIDMATGLLPPILAGFACAGILAASISSSDSYLLISTSALAENVYHGIIKKDASDKQIIWVSRIAMAVITVISMIIAWDANSTIFGITSFAWAGFGATFGPLMLFSLFWKRTTYAGAIAGMLTGGIMVFVWKLVIAKLGGVFAIYELLPAFIISSIVIVAVSLATKKPSEEVEADFDAATAK